MLNRQPNLPTNKQNIWIYRLIRCTKANKPMKRFSASLTIREMTMKTTMTGQFTSTKLTVIKKKHNELARMWRNSNSHTLLVGCVKWTSHFRTTSGSSSYIKHSCHMTQHFHSWVQKQELKTHVYTNTLQVLQQHLPYQPKTDNDPNVNQLNRYTEHYGSIQ